MGKKFKITEDQLKRLVENKSRIQEQNEGYVDEEIDGPSKEEYFAKHGQDDIGWTGSSNKTYQDLPDGDYDDETYDDFELVVVDPDSDFQHKSINIEIQPRAFTSLALIGDSNTKNWTNESYTTWHNFKVDDNCKRIMVAPDLELIAEAVEFARNNCDGEMTLLENKTVKRESTEWSDRDWRSSPALVYQDWLRNAIENNKGLRLGLD